MSETTHDKYYDGISICDKDSSNNETLHQSEEKERKRNLSSLVETTLSTNNHNHEEYTHTKNKKKGKKPKTKHIDPKILSLRRTIHLCCATNDFHTAIEAYQNIHIKENVPLESQTFYNLLNLCEGGIGERGIHIGTPKSDEKQSNNAEDTKQKNSNELSVSTISTNEENRDEKTSHIIKHYYSPNQRKQIAFKIKSEMDLLQIPLNETAYTALIRILCQPENNDLFQAEQLLDQAENTQQCKPKLRMYSCLIEALCNEVNNDLVGALRIWCRIHHLERKDKNGQEQTGMELSEKEYCYLLKCAIRIGDVKVAERVLSEIAEDILVPSQDTRDAIVSWFKSKYAVIDTPSNSSAIDRIEKLPKCNAPSMGPLQHFNGSDYTCNETSKWEITCGDKINTENGTILSGCLEGETLKPIQVKKESWKKLIQMNEDIVVKGEIAEHANIQYAGGGKGKKRRLSIESMEKRIKQWNNYKAFLLDCVGPISEENDPSQAFHGKKKFDIVIDGANVGYYQRNFSNAPKHVDYKQIDWVVDHFCEQGKRVLLVMHMRHFSKNLLPKWAESIVNKWDENGILYRTPHGFNDDWFWMHAALWCGRGTKVLSNDKLRDHHFQMLAYRSFLRWKERHQVYFDFGEWKNMKREVLLTYPDVYSRRIQRVGSNGLVIPLPKKGDENRFLDGLHEADDTAPVDETYLCIKLNKVNRM